MTYRELVQRQINKKLSSSEAMSNCAMGIAGESGEVCDLIKKVQFHGRPFDKEKLLNELGDVRFYMEWLLLLIGSSLEEVETSNTNKLLKRYPDGFSAKDSSARVDVTE